MPESGAFSKSNNVDEDVLMSLAGTIGVPTRRINGTREELDLMVAWFILGG
jgi:hypothetical protein